MPNFFWELSVLGSRWRNRLRYVFAAPSAYRNWWAMVLPKLGISVILELRNGLRYLVRSGRTDLGIINEAVILNPYLSGGLLAVSEDSIVVDVGANIGDFTMQAAQLCRLGRVIAVEPISEQARMLGIHVLLNDFDNVTHVHAALGGHEGQVDMHVEGGFSSAYWGGDNIEKVRMTTLPLLMREQRIQHIHLLKLDCEGAEWDILPAAEEVLPQIDQICMEFHNARGWTSDKLAQWLRERGYKVWHTSGSWNGLLWARRSEARQNA